MTRCQAALLASLAAFALAPVSCTMPEQGEIKVRSSYPPIVETETGGRPMLQDSGSGMENAVHGVKNKN
ncbi:MAG: hypothetical protein QF489_09085 [Planctomycetota bacterium]|jgi:hypothetical protein|nr:hypothetical protein [Planctomycetota bacterium]